MNKVILNRYRKLIVVLIAVLCASLSIVMPGIPAKDDGLTVKIEVNPQHYYGETVFITAQTFYNGETTSVDKIICEIIRPDEVKDEVVLNPLDTGFGNLHAGTYTIPGVYGDYIVIITVSLNGSETYDLKIFRCSRVFGPVSEIVHDIGHMHQDMHGVLHHLNQISISLWIITALLIITLVTIAISWRKPVKLERI